MVLCTFWRSLRFLWSSGSACGVYDEPQIPQNSSHFPPPKKEKKELLYNAALHNKVNLQKWQHGAAC